MSREWSKGLASGTELPKLGLPCTDVEPSVFRAERDERREACCVCGQPPLGTDIGMKYNPETGAGT